MRGAHSHKFLLIHLRTLHAFARRCVDACSVARTTCGSICVHMQDRWSARRSTIASTATRSSMALHFCRYTCAHTQVTMCHSGYDWSRVLSPKHWQFLIDSQVRSHIGVTSAARASHRVVPWRSIDACTPESDHMNVKRCVLYPVWLKYHKTGFYMCLIIIIFRIMQWLSQSLKCMQADIYSRYKEIIIRGTVDLLPVENKEWEAFFLINNFTYLILFVAWVITVLHLVLWSFNKQRGIIKGV